jgi:hypothetical protein
VKGLRGTETTNPLQALEESPLNPVHNDPLPEQDNKIKKNAAFTKCQVGLLIFLAVIVGGIVLFGVGVFICLTYNHIGYVLKCPEMTKDLLADMVKIVLTASATLFFGSLFNR